MLNDSTFGSDLAELTYPELRDVAEKLRARLQELERDARANKAAPSDHAPPPHPASPDIGREPVFGDDGKHLGSRGSGCDTTQVSAEKEPHQELLFAIERLPVGLMLWDAKDRLLFKNSEVKTLLAQAPVPELGETFEAGIRRVAYSGAVKLAIGREEAFIQDRMDLHRRFGEAYDLQVDGYTLEITNYEFEGGIVMALLRDVTELRETQQQLRDQEAFYGTILESLNEGVVVRAANGDLLFHNRSAKGGYSEGPWATVEDAAEFRKSCDLIHEDGARYSGAKHIRKDGDAVLGYRTPDGARMWISVSYRALFRPGETTPYGYVQTATDVTKIKEREAELVAQQDRLRKILDNMPVMMLALDDAAEFLFWNKESEAVTGYTVAEIVGNPKAWELLVPDETYREQVFKERKSRKDFRNLELRLQTKDGREVIVAFSSMSESVLIPEWHVWVIGVDITDRVEAQQQVTQQKEGFRQVLQEMPVMMNAFDEDYVCVAWNRECERVTGYSAAEMIGNPAVPELAMPDPVYRARMMELWPAKRFSREWEVDFRAKDGRKHTIAWSGISEECRFPGWECWAFGVDVTERNAAQQQVAERTENLRNIIQNMPVMMNAFDGDGNCAMWNRECELVTGYSSEEMLGRKAVEIVVPDSTYRETMMREWQTKGDHRDWLWRFTTKSGDERFIAWSNISRSFPIPGWKRWGIGVDVTDRVNAQEDVRQQGERLRAVFDSLHDGLIIADDTGKIVDVNRVTVGMFGYDREEIIGEILATIMPGELDLEHDGYLAAYSKNGKASIIGKGRKISGRHKSGREFPLHLHVAEFERGGQKYLVVSTRDLTEIERLESYRRQSDKLAAVGRLAGGIAHDFNNLLLPIITLTEIMLSDKVTEEKRIDRHKVVLAAAVRGSEIVEKFLAFSREHHLMIGPVDLPPIVEEVLGLVRDSALATITYQTSAQPVPPITANPGELHELVVNLVVNALDAVDEADGLVKIEIDHVSNDAHMPLMLEGQSYVRLSVSDNGVGMDDEVRDRMFDPFFTTKDVGVGSGLGLSVVHGIVERMKGLIEVSSKPDEGTTMLLYLPTMTTQ